MSAASLPLASVAAIALVLTLVLGGGWLILGGLENAPAPFLPPPPEFIEVGTRADTLYVLDSEGRSVRHRLPDDGKPVVVWFWSCLCRCIRDCEERIVALLERYPDGKIHLLAVDSNPQDSAEDIARLRAALESPYVVYRDDNGTTARHLGVTGSASVAILDGDRKLRFRGAIDDDLYDPTVSYIHESLDALFAGEALERTTAPSYGCAYPDPLR